MYWVTGQSSHWILLAMILDTTAIMLKMSIKSLPKTDLCIEHELLNEN